MIYKLRHIFIFLFVFSVFSITLQASVVSICKDSKVFKSQNQSNPLTEEEEERAHDGDESVDEEDLFYNNEYSGKEIIFQKVVSGWNQPDDEVVSSAQKILIPPPKAY